MRQMHRHQVRVSVHDWSLDSHTLAERTVTHIKSGPAPKGSIELEAKGSAGCKNVSDESIRKGLSA